MSDLSRLVQARRWRVQPEKPFDAVHANGLLLVGVEEMTNERAAELVSGNLDFRRASNGTLISIEDAVRKLLGRGHVRALIRVEVRIADSTAGLVIGRIMLGQRGGRIVLVIAQTRGRAPLPVRHPRRGPTGDLRLDQPLQPQPLHSSLGYIPPIEWESNYRQAAAPEAA